MKSAIGKYGYYVHYWAENALKHIKFNDGELTQYAVNKLKNVKDSFYSGLSVQQKQDYANLINALHGRNNLQADGWNNNEVWKTIEKIIRERNNLVDENIVARESGKILGDPKDYKQRLNTKFLAISTAADLTNYKLQEIQRIINEIGTQSALTEAELKNLEDSINEYYVYIEKMLKEHQKYFTKDASELTKELGIRTKKDQKYHTFSEDWTIKLKNINAMLKQFKYDRQVLTLAQGDLEELVSLVAAYQVAGLSAKTLEETIKNALNNPSNTLSSAGAWTGGSHKNTFHWNIQGLPTEAIQNTWLNQGVTFPDKRIKIQSTPAQEKVDIVLPIVHDDWIRGVPTSVKNIDLSSDFGVSLVSGTNVWYLIQDETNQYKRKYLNIMANHIGSDVTLRSLRKDAVLSLKILTAYKALTGATLGRNAAKLFVVNDNHSKNIYVLEMSDILQLIYQEIEKTPSKIDDLFHFSTSAYDLIEGYKNDWVEGPVASGIAARMGELIQDVHARKISAAFQPAAANSIITTKGIKGLRS